MSICWNERMLWLAMKIIVFLFFATRLLAARYSFPAWMLVISVYILILNYHCTQDQEFKDFLDI